MQLFRQSGTLYDNDNMHDNDGDDDEDDDNGNDDNDEDEEEDCYDQVSWKDSESETKFALDTLKHFCMSILLIS